MVPPCLLGYFLPEVNEVYSTTRCNLSDTIPVEENRKVVASVELTHNPYENALVQCTYLTIEPTSLSQRCIEQQVSLRAIDDKANIRLLQGLTYFEQKDFRSAAIYFKAAYKYSSFLLTIWDKMPEKTAELDNISSTKVTAHTSAIWLPCRKLAEMLEALEKSSVLDHKKKLFIETAYKFIGYLKNHEADINLNKDSTFSRLLHQITDVYIQKHRELFGENPKPKSHEAIVLAKLIALGGAPRAKL